MDEGAPVEPWVLENSLASLRCGMLSGSVDITRPDRGLHRLSLGLAPFEAGLFCILRDDASFARSSSIDLDPGGADPWPVADAYVRGSDLVVTYQSTQDWPYAPQVYWRANPYPSNEPWLMSLEQFVSVQTHLLESWPRISVTSNTPAEELLSIDVASSEAQRVEALRGDERIIRPSAGQQCVVHRVRGGQWSYAEIMPASDFCELTVRHDVAGIGRSHWQLFADFLEKGVIWRARLHAIAVPRDKDIETTLAYCQSVEQRPLPLTT